MKLVFLGPPGAGKGTQASLLSKDLNIPHISTGEILRKAVKDGTELGKKIQAVIDSGNLVPDQMIVGIIKERTSESDCSSGYILDGFPRTVEQAQALEEMMSEANEQIDKIVLFDVNIDELEERLNHRRGQETRVDDSKEIQVERLMVYEKQTKPLISYYEERGSLKRVDATGSIEEVQTKLKSVLDI